MDRIDLTKDNDELEKEFKKEEIYSEEIPASYENIDLTKEDINPVINSEEIIPDFEMQEVKDKNYYSQVEINETPKSKLKIVLPLLLILIILSFGVYYFLINTPKALFIKTFNASYNLFNKKIETYENNLKNNLNNSSYDIKVTQEYKTNNITKKDIEDTINNLLINLNFSFQDEKASSNLNVYSNEEEIFNAYYYKNKESFLKINDNYIKLSLDKKIDKSELNIIKEKHLKNKDFSKSKEEITIDGKDYKVQKLSLNLNKERIKEIDSTKNINSFTFDMYLNESKVLKYNIKIDDKEIILINSDDYFDFTLKQDERLKLSYIKEDDTVFINYEVGMISYTKEKDNEYSFVLKNETDYYNGKVLLDEKEISENEKEKNITLNMFVNNATDYNILLNIKKTKINSLENNISGNLLNEDFKDFINNSINDKMKNVINVYKKPS